MYDSEKTYALGIYEKALPSFLSMEEKLQAAKACDFDFLELSIDESQDRQMRLKWTDEEIFRLAGISMKCKLPIRSICLSAHRKYPLGSHDSLIRSRGLEIAEDAISLADKLGVRIIQLAGYDVYYEDSDQITRLYFEQNLRYVVELAAQKGVTLAFETMETEFMDTVQKALHYIQDIDSPYLQLYPDIGNLSNAAQIYQQPIINDLMCGKGHIVAAHLKETAPGKYRNMKFGTGCTDYIACIRALWKLGVRRYTGEFWYLGQPDWFDELKSAASFLHEKLIQVENRGFYDHVERL